MINRFSEKALDIIGCSHDENTGMRCECGCMLAVLRKNGLELKCRRCKRFVLIAFPPGMKLVNTSHPAADMT